MRLVVASLVPLLALAACATPRESCINDATRDLRQVNRFISETQGNIARGFGYETRQETRVRMGTCQGETSEGVEFEFECEKTDIIDRRVPVPLDLAAERARLDSLLAQQATLERQSNAVVQACVAAHPE